MKILVCYKCVPFSEEIKVNSNRSLDTAVASLEVGQYDLRAVETAMRIKEADGESSVAVLTVGGDAVSNSKMKKAILARGPAEMYGVQDASLESADTFTTASVLKAAVEKIGDVDLVLCGEGSSDMYAQQVGNVLGAMLGWNTLNAVCAAERDGDGLRVERVVADGKEVLGVALPAVLSVTADINIPRIATMKDILGAGKKPATVWSLADVVSEVEAKNETISLLAPEETERKCVVFEDAGEENLAQFVSALKKCL